MALESKATLCVDFKILNLFCRHDVVVVRSLVFFGRGGAVVRPQVVQRDATIVNTVNKAITMTTHANDAFF